MKAFETKCVRIEVWRSRKKIREGKRNTIGWLGDKNDRQLIYWKSNIRRGRKMTRSTESIELKSRLKNKNEFQEGILIRCVEIEMMF